MLENKFKTKLIKEIRERLPGAIVLHINPPPQGIPDLLVLNGERWAALEGKKESNSSHRPNQDYLDREDEQDVVRCVHQS